MELFFRKIGKGYPIIILHGLYGMSDNWMTIARILSVNNEIWLPDLRNHGHSPHADIHTYESLSMDVVEFIDTHKIHKPIIIGHSMGGKVAMTLAKNNQEHIAGLCIVDIAPKNYNINETQDLHSHQHIIQSLCSLDIDKIQRREEADELLSKYLPSPMLRAFLLKNLQRTQTGFKWLFNLPVFKKYLPQIAGGFDESWRNTSISGFPVLFLKGEQSDYITKEDYALIEQIFPGSVMQTISNAGHWLHAQNPEAFIKAIKENLLA